MHEPRLLLAARPVVLFWRRHHDALAFLAGFVVLFALYAFSAALVG
jgi:hypothetical protein